MAHFAKVINGVVVDVIVAEEPFIHQRGGDPNQWVQTSYNTHGGVHTLGGTPLRKNYAGIGYAYDSERDAFIPPKPFESWVLNEGTCLWDAPVPIPADGDNHKWDETTISWVAVTAETDLVLAQENPAETPVQPYPSWTWNGTEWAAPTPNPNPNNPGWYWAEDIQEWELNDDLDSGAALTKSV